MSKKITVTIKARQTLEYCQDVEMEEEDFMVLKDLQDDCVTERVYREEYSLIQKYLDQRDVFDSGHEYFDVEIYKTRPIKPKP